MIRRGGSGAGLVEKRARVGMMTLVLYSLRRRFDGSFSLSQVSSLGN